jgi:hypothetical protein
VAARDDEIAAEVVDRDVLHAEPVYGIDDEHDPLVVAPVTVGTGHRLRDTGNGELHPVLEWTQMIPSTGVFGVSAPGDDGHAMNCPIRDGPCRP